MGNDIKLPVSQRNTLIESQKASDVEAKAQLKYEIEEISERVEAIILETDKIEHGLKQTNRNIAYYKKLVVDMSKTLQEIQMEQTNAHLAHENHVEKAKQYLESLREFQERSDTESMQDPDADMELTNLEATVAMLNHSVAKNEEFIVNQVLHNKI